MFKLKKLHPPFGTKDAPVIEAAYGEGAIEIVDGVCEVRFPETRDRLIKLGFNEVVPAEGGGEEISEPAAEQSAAAAKQKSHAKTGKKRR